MKKTRNLFKVTACLVVCFALVIGNPIKADAGWLACYFGIHNFVQHYTPATCKDFAYYESICADCGESCGKVYNVAALGKHCFTTDPYEKPTCIYCGFKKTYHSY